jgi:hypothetical protein
VTIYYNFIHQSVLASCQLSLLFFAPAAGASSFRADDERGRALDEYHKFIADGLG